MESSGSSVVKEALKTLSTDVHDFCGSRVERIDASQLESTFFLRTFVLPSRPVLIENAARREGWKTEGWANKDGAYLSDLAGDELVTVAITPNGLADALTVDDATGVEVFAQPHQRRQKLADFFRDLRQTRESGAAVVPYLSAQNSSLTKELPALLPDVSPDVSWATSAFGPPDACNIWIGDDRSVTTFHRDHYENIFVVVNGSKTFKLLPPTDTWRLGMREAPAARYDASLRLQREEPERFVRWCGLDPRTLEGLGPGPPPLEVTVRAGEALYLPAMWVHGVAQKCAEDGGPCVAVNFWYDMEFSHRWPFVKLVETLSS